eukprot:UN27077
MKNFVKNKPAFNRLNGWWTFSIGNHDYQLGNSHCPFKLAGCSITRPTTLNFYHFITYIRYILF